MVASQDDLLLEGEHQVGRYMVQIARWTGNNWIPTVPPLHATVTNMRLILKPQTRKPYPPASIPSTYITKVRDVLLSQRDGVLISLKTGQRLYLIVGWTDGGDFTEDVKFMLTSPLGANFAEELAQRDLRRIIRFLKKL